MQFLWGPRPNNNENSVGTNSLSTSHLVSVHLSAAQFPNLGELFWLELSQILSRGLRQAHLPSFWAEPERLCTQPVWLRILSRSRGEVWQTFGSGTRSDSQIPWSRWRAQISSPKQVCRTWWEGAMLDLFLAEKQVLIYHQT